MMVDDSRDGMHSGECQESVCEIFVNFLGGMLERAVSHPRRTFVDNPQNRQRFAVGEKRRNAAEGHSQQQ